MDVNISQSYIYIHEGKADQPTYACYRISTVGHCNVIEKNDTELAENSPFDKELWTEVKWTHEQWAEFFSCYLTAKNTQISGKLHSILESFGGSEKEVKARKSVTFQLLELRGLR